MNKKRFVTAILTLLIAVFTCFGLISCEKPGRVHEWGEWTVKTPATCTTAGVSERKCLTCDETETKPIEATGHDWEGADCESPRTCKNCAETDGEPLGHSYGAWVSNGDGTHTKTCVNDSTHTVTENCAGGNATCGNKPVCDDCGEEYGSVLGHSFTNYVSNGDATCEENGTETAVCDRDDCNEEDTREEEDSVLGHSFTNYESNNDATCEENGTETAVCDRDDCNEEDTREEEDSALGHDYDDGVVTTDPTCEEAGVKTFTCGNCQDTYTEAVAVVGHSYEAVVTEPTCDEKGYTTHTCGNCGDSYTDTEVDALGHDWDKEKVTCEEGRECESCGATEDALNHDYKEDTDAFQKATCTTPAVRTYVCANCGDSYEEEDGAPNGHNIKGVTATEVNVNGCEFKQVYACKDCSTPIDGETFYRHTYVATITTPATCEEDGVKTLVCSACGNTETETIEQNATGHAWTEGTPIDGKRTDTCENCGATKEVTVYVGKDTGSVNASNFANTEIELNSANITMDQGVIDAIGNKNVTLSADKLEGDDRLDLGLSAEKLSQVGDSPIYNFTINDGTSNISKFGEENYVTITIPYEYTEGEDVDSIAVWFINDDGELESIKATYNNGYVTFKTNHFSYYTVTKLTAEERCKLYDHSYATSSFAGDCTTDAYDLKVCVRCHDTIKEITKVANGHDYDVTVTEATCIKSGKAVYKCKDCGHTYQIKLNATGHKYTVVEEVDATCLNRGYVKSVCENCGKEKVVYSAQLKHVFTVTVVEPTCETHGYTLHDCDNCDYSYKDNISPALGHSYVSSWEWAEDYTSATLVFVCEHDEDHTFEKSANVTVKVTPATCQAEGKTTYTARVSYNGRLYTNVQTVVIEKLPHEYSSDWKYDEESHWKQCACGEKTEVSAHELGDGVVTKEPTCEETGEKTYTCDCGYTYSEEISAFGHEYENGVVSKEATCDKAGEKTYTCANCGETYTEEIPAFGHDFDEGVVTKEATCKEAGEKTFTCGNCGETKTEIIKKLSHEFEYGVCVNCGEAEPSEEDCDHTVLTEKTIDLAEFGTCGGIVTVSSCACGEVVIGDVQNFESNCDIETMKMGQGVDENGVPYMYMEGLCSDCGLLIMAKVTMTQNGCEQSQVMAYTFIMEEETVFEVTLIYTGADHNTEEAVIEFKDYSDCGTKVYVEQCKDCGEITYVYNYEIKCDYEETTEKVVDENGNEHVVTTLVCKVCGLSCVEDVWTEVESVCVYTTYRTYTALYEGEVIFEYKSESYVDNHEYEYVYELPESGDCEDGCKVIQTCTICGEKDIITHYGHNYEYGKKVELPTECGGYVILDVCNQCGIASDLYDVQLGCEFDEDAYEEGEFTDENGFVHYYGKDVCKVCGLAFVEEMWEETYACVKAEYEALKIYNGEEVIVYVLYDYVEESHMYEYTYQKQGETCDDGYRVTCYCPTCGKEETWYSSGHRETYKEVDFKKLGACGGGANYYSCDICGEITNVGWMDVECEALNEQPETREETDENGIVHMIMDATCPVCGLRAYVDSWQEGKSACATITYMRMLIEMNNETLFDYVQKYEDAEHDYEYTYEKFGDSCEDGYRVYVTCKVCGESSSRESWEHNYQKNYVNLGEYTPCGGSFGITACGVCGEIVDTNSNIGCELDEGVMEEITGDDGAVYQIRTQTCPTCGMQFVTTIWMEEKSACVIVGHMSAVIVCDGEEIFSFDFSEEMAEHDYEYSYEMKGETCYDGYTVYATCTACGESDSWWESGHRNVEKSIELGEYTECGGRFTVSMCEVCEHIWDPMSELGCVFGEPEFEATDTYTCIKQTCLNCGMQFVTEYWREDETPCVFIAYMSITIIYDGEEIFYIVGGEKMVEHDYEYSYEMKGETCNDGYTLYETCKTCGDTKSSFKTYHTMQMTEVQFKDYGACGGGAKGEVCIVCGQQNGDAWFNCRFEYVKGENGEQIKTCQICGLQVVEFSSREDLNACEYVIVRQILVSMNGEVIFDGGSKQNYINHDYEYTYKMYGETCDDGYEVYQKCRNCSANGSWSSSGCNSNYTTLQFTEYTSCNVSVEVDVCSVCGKITYFHGLGEMCEINEDEVTVEEGFDDNGRPSYVVSTAVCPVCGLTYVDRAWVEYETSCAFTLYQSFTIYADDVCIFEYVSSGEYQEEHELEESFEMFGESCEDGYNVVVTCKNCDEYYEETYYNHHESFTVVEYKFDELGGCGGYVYANECPCGQEKYAYCDMWNCNYEFDGYGYTDDYGVEHDVEKRTCPTCGLVDFVDCYYVKEGCYKVEYKTRSVTFGEMVILEGFTYQSNIYEDHDYGYTYEMYGESCEDGYTVVYTCKDCGDSYQGEYYYHNTFTLEHYDLKEYGGCGGYVEINVCPCERNYNVNYNFECDYTFDNTSYEDENGYTHYPNLYTCEDCGLEFSSNAYWYKEGCETVEHRTINLSIAGEALIVDHEYIYSRNESHEYTTSFELYGETCDDGYKLIYTCKDCGTSYSEERSGHSTYQVANYDLTEYGACSGELVLNMCPCKTFSYFYTYSCGNYTSNQELREDGHMHYIEALSCDTCNLRYQRDYYTVRDASTCSTVTYNKVLLTIGSEVICSLEFTNKNTQIHDYLETGVLTDGATSCEEGAIIIRTCKDCGYSYSNEYNYHKTYAIARYDLADYGATCGGYIVEQSCACGYSHNTSISNTLCDWDERYISSSDCWIENVVSYNYGYEYTCAVTDGKDGACGFKMRYCIYQLREGDSCYVRTYQTWQLGYDEQTGTYAHEFTFTMGGVSSRHNYQYSVISGTEDGYTIYGDRYDCACGTYYYYKYYQGQDGRNVQYEYLFENALQDDNYQREYRLQKYTWYIDEYNNYDYYTNFEYEEWTYENGSTYWEEETYSYDFDYTASFGDNGRAYTKTYKTSNGSNSIRQEAWVNYKGYRYYIYSCTFENVDSENEYWYRYDYTYELGSDCLMTSKYTNSNGEESIETSTCHNWGSATLNDPTCTQDGLNASICYICEQTTDTWTTNPHGHDWYYNGDGYTCSRCDMENANGADGSVVLEDLTVAYGEETNYVVGYWNQTEVDFTYYVSLILETGEEIILEGISFTEIEGVRAVAFSKAEVAEKATALGREVGTYDVRFAFVPYGADSSFDYAVTFTA